jgi:hypothetical protein
MSVIHNVVHFVTSLVGTDARTCTKCNVHEFLVHCTTNKQCSYNRHREQMHRMSPSKSSIITRKKTSSAAFWRNRTACSEFPVPSFQLIFGLARIANNYAINMGWVIPQYSDLVHGFGDCGLGLVLLVIVYGLGSPEQVMMISMRWCDDRRILMTLDHSILVSLLWV